MTISTERAQFLANIANDEWVDCLPAGFAKARFEALGAEWDKKRREFLANVSDAAELHLFADLWNWDSGMDEMYRVIAAPICERATALLVFWRASPDYYQGCQNADDLAEYERDGFALIRAIEAKFMAGDFADGSLRYDPNEMCDLSAVRAAASGAGWLIPTEMLEPIG
ncbi:MAG: DUF4274 domain-containing protein [Pseudomonadota bacterium]